MCHTLFELVLWLAIRGGIVQEIFRKNYLCLQRADEDGYVFVTSNRKESAFLPGVNAEVEVARRG